MTTTGRSSRIGRTVQFFREADLDEARVALTLVNEVMEQRLRPAPTAAPRKRRARKTAPTGDPTEVASAATAG